MLCFMAYNSSLDEWDNSNFYHCINFPETFEVCLQASRYFVCLNRVYVTIQSMSQYSVCLNTVYEKYTQMFFHWKRV